MTLRPLKIPLLSRDDGIRLLITERRTFYDKIVTVSCPILEDNVHFRSKGFFHLINESSSTHYKTISRPPEEQRHKLMCLEYVPFVITNATEIFTTRLVRRKDSKGRWKKVKQYALVATVPTGKRVRVVIEQVGSSDFKEYQFLSTMKHKKGDNQKNVLLDV